MIFSGQQPYIDVGGRIIASVREIMEVEVPIGFTIEKLGETLCFDHKRRMDIFTNNISRSIKVEGICQYTISVSKMEESVAWYEKFSVFI